MIPVFCILFVVFGMVLISISLFYEEKEGFIHQGIALIILGTAAFLFYAYVTSINKPKMAYPIIEYNDSQYIILNDELININERCGKKFDKPEVNVSIVNGYQVIE